MGLELTIVIPIYNEEAILETAVRALVGKLRETRWSWELILAENGSKDRTLAIAQKLAGEIDGLRVLHVGAPNYGRALREGIEGSRGTFVVCDEIDLGDVGFYTRALELLRGGADLVVGSKRHPDSVDARPWIRRRGTQVINGLLRVSLGFRGTDTHGLKAFKRERMMPVIGKCTVEHDLFASELVIRAMREDLECVEIPLDVQEIRPPSINLFKRVPRVLKNLARLVYVIRLRDP
jgi:glycosyltransferase involved in cell wall biosynthesis